MASQCMKLVLASLCHSTQLHNYCHFTLMFAGGGGGGEGVHVLREALVSIVPSLPNYSIVVLACIL